MITVFLRGGLGNQMFQYALGINLAKKNKTGLVLDTVHLGDRFPRPHFVYRTFDLDIFDIKPQFTALSNFQRTLPIPGVWLGLDLMAMGVADTLGTQKTIYEMSERFDPAVLEKKGDMVLFGKWQNEKYFAEIADEVRSAFRFRHLLEGEAKMLAEKIISSDSISIHVRRGDYASFKNVEAMMGKTDLGYYARATAYIGERVKMPQFFVFSDDIAWCKENIKLSFPTTYLDDASAGPKASHHLHLMSLCKHNIVTNSTFSWWGAWLNANSGKIVIAPKQWYMDLKKENDADIVPSQWVRL